VDDSNSALSLVDSSLRKLNVWCCRQLENYHAYFSKVCPAPLRGIKNV
jgi:hypothetical protein